MPKSVRYKADSVVFFHGDLDERIYILKSGRIILKSRDIETGQEVRDLVQTGEFFGVRSSLGKHPREEDALVLTDSEVVQFSTAEFEQLVSANTRIIIKMLKVFSNQLRRIHAKVSSMLNQQNTIDAEEGLHQSASFYFQHRQFGHASYIWKRYLELYPNGRYVDEVKRQIVRAGQSSSALDTPSEGGPPPASSGDHGEDSGAAAVYFEAESAFANDKFDNAVELFTRVVKEFPDDDEYVTKARIELGRCYFEKGDFAGTIRHYSQLIQDLPRLPQLPDILYYVAMSYAKSGDGGKAKSILAKARNAATDDTSLRRKIDKALRDLEG